MDNVLILDFGSQYTQLIARRIRELNVYCEILPYDVDTKKIESLNPKAIILDLGDFQSLIYQKVMWDILKVPPSFKIKKLIDLLVEKLEIFNQLKKMF